MTADKTYGIIDSLQGSFILNSRRIMIRLLLRNCWPKAELTWVYILCQEFTYSREVSIQKEDSSTDTLNWLDLSNSHSCCCFLSCHLVSHSSRRRARRHIKPIRVQTWFSLRMQTTKLDAKQSWQKRAKTASSFPSGSLINVHFKAKSWSSEKRFTWVCTLKWPEAISFLTLLILLLISTVVRSTDSKRSGINDCEIEKLEKESLNMVLMSNCVWEMKRQ